MPPRKEDLRTDSLKSPSAWWIRPTLITALVLACVILVAVVAQDFLWDYSVEETSKDCHDALNRNAYLIEARLRGRANDMFFLKRVAEDELVRDPKAPPISDNLRSAITSMMLARSQYDKIFLLNLEGREILRYNWKGGDNPLEEVPANEFQDKSDRPFYHETVTALPNAAVFSPFELTLEHNQIVYPIRPVVRVSGQIIGPDGKPRALLFVNYQGEQLVRELRENSDPSKQALLLNGDGYLLVGPDRPSEFAFMYPSRQHENLKEQDPALWSRLTSQKSGSFEFNDSLYCFQTIDPIGSTTDYPPLRMPVRGGERLCWTLVEKVPNDFIWQDVRSIRKGIWATCTAAVLILGPVSWFGVTARQRRRREVLEVQKSRALLDNVFNVSLHGIIVMDAVRNTEDRLTDLRLVMANKSASDILGRDLANLHGATLLKEGASTKNDSNFDRYRRVIESGESVTFEHNYTHQNVRKWLLIRAARKDDGVVVTLADITERKLHEEQLRESQMRLINSLAQEQELTRQARAAEQALARSREHLNAILNSSLDGVIVYEAIRDEAGAIRDFRFGMLNPATEKLMRMPAADLIGHTVLEKFPNIVTDGLFEKFVGIVEEGSILDFEHLSTRTTPPRWYRIAGVKLGDGIVLTYTEITARKESEEALRLSEERFSNAFEYATTGMALVSMEGSWLKVNEALCDLIGYTAEELKGKTFQDITHPDDLGSDLSYVRQLIDGKISSYKMEKRYFHKDGHIVWILLGVSLLRDKQNKPLYFISQIEDITGIKQAMAVQKELTEKARAAERAKSEFLAVMSHEIRTPMNGVIGMTSILADTELNDTQRDCVHTIQTSGEALLTVINDILDFSKIESGRMTLEQRSFNLRQCLEDAIYLFVAPIREKKLETAYLIAPEVPANLLGDSIRLRQILINLLGNAIKFTERGEIILDVQCQNRDEKGCHLLFSITDTGIGIPPEAIGKLFQSFQQVDASTTRRYGGTGLGLAISKRLSELMGGTMWVESKAGVGSTFFFSAVMEAAPSSAASIRNPTVPCSSPARSWSSMTTPPIAAFSTRN